MEDANVRLLLIWLIVFGPIIVSGAIDTARADRKRKRQWKRVKEIAKRLEELREEERGYE